jgi:zinc transporter ZupT
MPFLRTLDRKWLHFFMAFTAGILVLLFFDTLGGALESAESMPSGLSGDGLVVFAAIGSFFLIMFGSNWLQSRTSGDRRVVIAYAVAAGIGLHNLGEGLAVGSAYRLGEIALGTFLVIGFAIHNTTEGLGIVSIIGDRKRSLSMLLALGMIAGVPTIFGAWMGAYLFNPWLATACLATAAGAIAEVVYDVMKVVHNEADGGLLSPASLIGLTVGLAVMYGTGLLIPA